MPEKAEAQKLVYTMEEVCRLSGLGIDIIESWEKELSFLNAGMARGGKRFFRERDVAIILRLKQLLEEKSMTLAGAKRRVEAEFGIKGASLPPEKLRKTLNQVRDQLQELAAELDKPLEF